MWYTHMRSSGGKVMLRSAGEVAPGVARHRVEYVHSELGRDLREAGHVTRDRLSTLE